MKELDISNNKLDKNCLLECLDFNLNKIRLIEFSLNSLNFFEHLEYNRRYVIDVHARNHSYINSSNYLK